MNAKDAVEYLDALADAQQGVSIATVADGWVFHFTANSLRSLLKAAEEGSGKALVFVQDSSKLPKVAGN